MNDSFIGGALLKKDRRDFLLGSYQPDVVIPDTFIQDTSWMPVNYQGKYPTCGAHAGASLKNGQEHSDLSPKFLWKVIKTFDGFPLEEGTTMQAIFKALQNNGICDSNLMLNTLEDSLTQYSNPRVITEKQRDNAKPNGIGNYAFIYNPSFQEIKQAIYQNKWVLALVDIGDGWWTPSWDRLNFPLKVGNKNGRHFVVFHSYNQFIFFVNSFSKDWGMKGHGYIDRNYPILQIGTAIDLPNQFIFTDDLYFGISSEQVRQLQKRLGFTLEFQTGFFGLKTQTAVMKYQSDNGIFPPHGFVGRLTRAKLNTT